MKTRITLMVAMMAIALTAAAMPFTEAREKALFLSDKMAYELNLTQSQYDSVYEINLDYLLNIDDETSAFGYSLDVRNRDLKQVLNDSQYDNYQACDWFCHPFKCDNNGWTLAVYERYDGQQLFMDKPDVYLSYNGSQD